MTVSLPWADWQFWIVTAAAVWGLWSLLRQLLPRRGQGDACGACAAGAAACAKKSPAVEKSAAQRTALVALEDRRAGK